MIINGKTWEIIWQIKDMEFMDEMGQELIIATGLTMKEMGLNKGMVRRFLK